MNNNTKRVLTITGSGCSFCSYIEKGRIVGIGTQFYRRNGIDGTLLESYFDSLRNIGLKKSKHLRVIVYINLN